MKYKGIIFDLDGVLCSTDRFHFEAWKQTAEEVGAPFDETINMKLRGVSRMESLEIILSGSSKTFTDAEKEQILSLMKKIGDLDIDMDALKQQASDIYDRLKDLGVDMSDLDKDTIVSAISKFFAGIIEVFKNLFS